MAEERTMREREEEGVNLNQNQNRTESLTERLTEILIDDGDGDLLVQQNERESNFLQWLNALDLQVVGACRVDERLKPLLKANNSIAAEDRLLSHLSHHFEPAEVGLLARCLCVPLVSVRVGKVVKRGTTLCPTSVRGDLNLTLLPSSGLRLSFVGDDGLIQRLATFSDVSDCSPVEIDEIPADQSGRSFLVKVTDGDTFYFWCSEKSMLFGRDLLAKMKDLLKTLPTLAELTGISASRLECFATHLRSYLAGSSAKNGLANSALDPVESGLSTRASLNSAKLLRSRHSGAQALKGHSQLQGTLSPRSSSFKEGLPRALSSLRTASREKLKRRGDLHLSGVDSSLVVDTVLNHSEKGNHSESPISSSDSPLNFLESLGKCSSLPIPSATSRFPPISSLLSPYYCWCPPSALPSMPSMPQFPSPFAEPFSLPPLSTLLPATGPPSLLPQFPPLDLSGGIPLDLPAFVSDPLSRLPLPKHNLPQFPTFTPLMCDPIVHLPVVDVCSSGYLVSAGPGNATNIPPLHPNFVGPMISESESVLEKGARETLRLLIGNSSGQPSGSFMSVFPAVLKNEDKQGFIVTGSRGLYSGTSDVDAIVNGFAAVGLAPYSDRGFEFGKMKRACTADTDVIEQGSNDLDFSDNNSVFESERGDM